MRCSIPLLSFWASWSATGMNLHVKSLLYLSENYLKLIYGFLHFYAYNKLHLSILYLTLSSLIIGATKEVETFWKDITTWKLTLYHRHSMFYCFTSNKTICTNVPEKIVIVWIFLKKMIILKRVLPILFYQKLISLKRKIFQKIVDYCRSDEKSCTRNLANTDIFKIVIESDENHNHVLFHSINTVAIHKDEIFFIQ